MATRTTRRGITRVLLPTKITREIVRTNSLEHIRWQERGGRHTRVEREYERSRRRKR